MLISYILPVYNVAEWLEHCLDSIVNQGVSPDEYEIIAVDDGSTDDSLMVLHTYQQKHSSVNISILSQKNGGASMARNNGLRIAQGEYIWWVDGDDSITPGCTIKILDIAKRDNLDILNFAISILYNNDTQENYPIKKEYEGKIMSGIDYMCSVGVPPNVWSSIYRRQFLLDNNLTLMEGVVHEDLEFPPRTYYMAKRVELSSINSYCYYQREGSVMRTSDPAKITKKSKDLLRICDSLYKFTTDNLQKDTPVYYSFMDKIAFAFSQSLRNYSKEAFQIKEYKKRPYYPLIYSNNISKNEKLKYMLINFSLPLYLFLLRYIKK